MNAPPAIPPGITWPVVAYAFVRELPYTTMVVCGAVVSAMFVLRSPGSSLEPLAAVIVPAIVSALGRSRPPEDLARWGGVGALAMMAFRR